MRTKDNMIFQYSTINALVAGIYDGNLTIGELSKYGNLGLGTFNHLDGEMVVLDGEFYKVKAANDPTVVRVSPDEKISFASVTNFKPGGASILLNEPFTLEGLQKRLDKELASVNIFYAFRMKGIFKSVKTRCVPIQERPYSRLTTVVEHQSRYEFKDIEGYLVGFWFPDYMKDINVPGYHFHFLSADKTRGGHLFECRTARLEIDAARILGFRMILPGSKEFKKTNLTVNEEELEIIEKGKKNTYS